MGKDKEDRTPHPDGIGEDIAKPMSLLLLVSTFY